MRWPPLLLFVGWLAILPPDLSAEEPPPDLVSCPSLLRQNPAANFHLVLGRLQLDPVRYRKGSQSIVRSTSAAPAASRPFAVPTSGEPITETMQVTSTRGIPAMHYSATSSLVRVTIDADGRGTWRIESQHLNSSDTNRVIVEQTPGKPIVMRCLSAQPELTIQAATWVHLREADRAIFAEHLEPIIDELLWSYQFHELADAAHTNSLQESSANTVDELTIKTWIEELRSPNRVQRINADRNLRAIGIALLPRLANIDPSTLDAEQRQRLSEIQAKLTPYSEDDAARLGTLIRDDVSYWQLASSRLNDREQQLVDTRFKRLGGKLPGERRGDSTRVATRGR